MWEDQAVQRTISAIRNFSNPLSPRVRDHLYSLASGASMSPEVELDVLRAEAAGNEAKETFICDRFINRSSEDLFFEPIKKLKLKTMDSCDKMIRLATSQGKIIQYREQRDLAFFQ